jgi:hypothetical protein
MKSEPDRWEEIIGLDRNDFSDHVLSEDGTTVAVGAPNRVVVAGYVRIFSQNGQNGTRSDKL